MTATKYRRLSSTRFGPAKPRTSKCTLSSYASKPEPRPVRSSSCLFIRLSNIWPPAGAPWTSPWKKDFTPWQPSAWSKSLFRMPLAMAARSPHRVTPSRTFCTTPISSCPRPSPSLARVCPRRKNSNQNDLCCEFSYLAEFFAGFGFGENRLHARDSAKRCCASRNAPPTPRSLSSPTMPSGIRGSTLVRCLLPACTWRKAAHATRQTSAVRRCSAWAPIRVLLAEPMPLGASGSWGIRSKPWHTSMMLWWAHELSHPYSLAYARCWAAMAGLFSFRIGVANWAQNELKGFVPCGVLLTRHTPHDPKPFDEGQS